MTVRRLTVSRRELFDLAVAWIALGVAFALFFEGAPDRTAWRQFLGPIAASLLTVGVAFLAHELAHKVVAVRYGQVAAFRADYGMLALAVVGGLAGFIFAAPGAVVHRGRLTDRERGLIALAGPVTNLLLAGLVAGLVALLLVAGAAGRLPAGVGAALGRAIQINALLAAFNLLPVGPLDGRTVRRWHTGVWLAVAAVAGGAVVLSILPGGPLAGGVLAATGLAGGAVAGSGVPVSDVAPGVLGG